VVEVGSRVWLEIDPAGVVRVEQASQRSARAIPDACCRERPRYAPGMDRDDVKLSKTLSYWLRHGPDVAGVELDASGWTKVDSVLAALAKQDIAADWQTLLRMVEINDKRRFELSGDADLIRSRQGHSVSVEADWRVALPPDVLWHGTVDRFLKAILAEGLKPMSRHHVHLSADRETAERVSRRRGSPVVLLIDAKRLADQGQSFRITGNGVWLTEHVPPRR
jgi:putative RNA 2'-phosphotransferase